MSTLELARRTPGTTLSVGTSGEHTSIVCGAFFFGDDDHPAVAGFPVYIHVPGQSGRPPGWLAGLTDALVAETNDGGPGSEVVMARLSDALITRALRYHVQNSDEAGWLRGLHDPYVARALAALHADLGSMGRRVARTSGRVVAGRLRHSLRQNDRPDTDGLRVPLPYAASYDHAAR